MKILKRILVVASLLMAAFAISYLVYTGVHLNA